jgi:hypothetical protein
LEIHCLFGAPLIRIATNRKPPAVSEGEELVSIRVIRV